MSPRFRSLGISEVKLEDLFQHFEFLFPVTPPIQRLLPEELSS
jgi:hypothetical protein